MLQVQVDGSETSVGPLMTPLGGGRAGRLLKLRDHSEIACYRLGQAEQPG